MRKSTIAYFLQTYDGRKRVWAALDSEMNIITFGRDIMKVAKRATQKGFDDHFIITLPLNDDGTMDKPQKIELKK